MRRLIAASVLCYSCSSPVLEPPEPAEPIVAEVVAAVSGELDDQEDAGPDDGGLVEEDAGAPSEGVSVARILAERPPYRDERYIARCRRESRRDAPASEVIEDRDEARRRARALARSGQLDPVLIFSRMAYGETGTPNPRHNDDPSTPNWDEAEAILAVIDNRRGRMSRIEMMVNYAPRRVFPKPGDERQAWISELQLDGARPPSWPRPRQRRHHGHPPWRQYGCPRWLATVDRVRQVLRSHPRTVAPGICEEVPDHWGGTMDRYGFERGWRRVTCGRGFTRNLFWVVPSRDVEGEQPTR